MKGEAPAHLVGVTGPPGAGKSSLLSALVARLARLRAARLRYSQSTLPPSASGGSLLGDRARIDHEPGDDGVLSAPPRRASGSAASLPATREAAEALAAAFDVVVVETVGVGQSETDVERGVRHASP